MNNATSGDVNEVLGAVRELLPRFRERAEQTERLRVLPEASMNELTDAGFFRLLQPRRFGGLEANPVDFYASVRGIAAACGSTGWVAAVLGVHPWHVALFADAAQQAVWGEDATARISSSYAPMGKAVRVEGGYQLTGKWSFSSGCDHCGWVLLGGLVQEADGAVSDFRTFLLPRDDYVIKDVWKTVGLRGTGSNDIVVNDTFVANDFTLSMSEMGRCHGPGQQFNDAPLYRLPFHSVFTSTISTPIIGMASSAYEEHLAIQKTRVRASYVGEHASLDPFAAVRIARAGSDIDAGWALTMSNIAEEMGYVERGEEIPLSLRLRTRRDQVLATQRAIDAVDSLFEASGGRALVAGTPLQRIWRDAHAGRVHAANDLERSLQLFGAHALGHAVDPGMY